MLAEVTLLSIAARQGHAVDPSTTKRGEIKYPQVRAHPAVCGEQATKLRDRKLYKAMCRAQEVVQAAPGYRRNRTWTLLREVL